jgi:hypothetical protein
MKSHQIAAVLTTLCALSVPAFAATTNAGHTVEQMKAQAESKIQNAGKGPYGTKAKLALYYRSGTGILASVGVAGVYEPSAGVVCVQPSVALDLPNAYPQVTVEWSWSSGFALLSYYTAGSYGCATGELSVYNYDFNAGGYPVPSSNVAFELVVL